MTATEKTVTRIEAQKKHQDRVNIYLDDAFAFGLSHEVLVRFALAKGDALNADRLQAIQSAEAVQAAKGKALALIAYRPRSVEEIRKRLTEKDFPPAAVDQAIEDLCRVGLLDDTQFAAAFIRTRLIQRPSGKRLLTQELRLKGLSEIHIEEALESIFSSLDETGLVRELAEKRLRHLPEDRIRARKRLSDFLLRRGFSWDTVKPVVDELLQQTED